MKLKKLLLEYWQTNGNFMPKQVFWKDEFVYADKMTYFGYEVHPNCEKVKKGEYLIDYESRTPGRLVKGEFDDVYWVVEKVKGIAVWCKCINGRQKGKKEVFDLAAFMKTGEYKGPLKNTRPAQKYKGKQVYFCLPLQYLWVRKFKGKEIPTRVGNISKHDKKIFLRRESDYHLALDLREKRFKV